VTPIHAVAPPARTIVALVNCRTRACARSRSWAEWRSRVRLTVIDSGVVPASAHGRWRGPRLLRSVRAEPDETMTAGRAPPGRRAT
jgi:hypothetical protein